MKLEQSLYEARPVEDLRVYQVGDLENLSAVALGYGTGSGGGIKMTIRPLGPNSQLHIHEGEKGTAHIKTRKGEYQNLNSYDAAMIDLQLDKAGVIKIKK